MKKDAPAAAVVAAAEKAMEAQSSLSLKQKQPLKLHHQNPQRAAFGDVNWMRMLKIFLSFLQDPDTWIGGSGLALVFVVPTIEGVILGLKLFSAFAGAFLVCLSIYHKTLQVRNEKKNNGTSGNG